MRGGHITNCTVPQNQVIKNTIMNCALKTQCRSRAICKEEIPETALARSLLLETTSWTPNPCCVGTQLALDEICSIAAEDCCVTKAQFPMGQPCFFMHLRLQLLVLHCFFQTIPPSLELEKRAFSSMTDKEPRVHHLLRDRTFGHCSSTISFSSGLPGLNQPFPSTGYFPYYRTEEELCPGPVLGDRFFPGIGGLVNKDGEERGETDIWSLSSNCLLC